MSHLLKRVVFVGGGSGGFATVKGLMDYPIDLRAIGTVFDSGGSTGELRDVHGALPQGDLRRLLLAMLPGETDWRELFAYRFPGTGFLKNHSLGNLLLYAAERLWGRREGVQRLGRLLGARGTVLPVSTDNAHLVALLSDGTEIVGEHYIDVRPKTDPRSLVSVRLDRPAMATRDAVEAIAAAEYIILGPGDLYTSVIPNLITSGIAEAINTSNAKLIFVANLMTKAAETRGYGVCDFLAALRTHGVERMIDVTIVPSDVVPPEILEFYQTAEDADVVVCDDEQLRKCGEYTRLCYKGPLISQHGLEERLVRHGTHKLAHMIMNVVAGTIPEASVIRL